MPTKNADATWTADRLRRTAAANGGFASRDVIAATMRANDPAISPEIPTGREPEADRLNTVRTHIGYEYTWQELKMVFDMVAPAGDWKGPILATIAPAFLPALFQAVPFFTGSTVAVIGLELVSNRPIVRAAGYYASMS